MTDANVPADPTRPSHATPAPPAPASRTRTRPTPPELGPAAVPLPDGLPGAPYDSLPSLQSGRGPDSHPRVSETKPRAAPRPAQPTPVAPDDALAQATRAVPAFLLARPRDRSSPALQGARYPSIVAIVLWAAVLAAILYRLYRHT